MSFFSDILRSEALGLGTISSIHIQVKSLFCYQCRYSLMYYLATRFLDECDGIINCTTRDFEPGAIDSLQDWIAPRPVFSVGCPSPPVNAAENEKITKTDVGAGVKAFLDSALNKHGPNSVIFVRDRKSTRLNSSH